MIGELGDRRIALAHDWLVGVRGGELVLDRLARLVGPTDLYTLVADGRPMTEAIDACRIVTSPLQRLPGACGRGRRVYLPIMPWAVGRLRVASCDLLISTSSAVMKSIRPPVDTPHLCYCHAPARYVWQDGSGYASRRGSSGGWWRGLGLRAVAGPFRRWDRRTADRVTRFVANSRHIAREIQRCFGREAAVVHPPVRTQWFTPPDDHARREDWLLVAGALEPYKRVDLAIEAARRGGFRLRIAGTGSQRQALAAMAGRGVEMLGWVDETRLRELYRTARAMIFPQVEDFGIAAVEAQACGCPVLAYAAGGALDSVTPQTGVLFETQTADAIVDAVRTLDSVTFDAGACRGNAERFAETRFDREMTGHIEALLR